ncbi:hypothetical protein M378DRAFT_93383, partial [Amanita muscaria Koide BX008]
GSTDEQTEEEFNDSMRVEWVKARARKMRWQEEFLIVQEEMRRVLVWFEWKAGWWEEQALRRGDSDLNHDILQGVAAYAYKQAEICGRMATRFAKDWLPLLKRNGITPSWEAKYVEEGSPNENGDGDDAEGDSDAIDGEVSEEEIHSDIGDDDKDGVFLGFDN